MHNTHIHQTFTPNTDTSHTTQILQTHTFFLKVCTTHTHIKHSHQTPHTHETHNTHLLQTHTYEKKKYAQHTPNTCAHTITHTIANTITHTLSHTHTQTECWRRSKGWPGTVATGWSWCWEVFTMLPSNSWDLMRLQQHHTAASVSTGIPSTASGKSSRGYQINHNHPHMVSKKTCKINYED